MFIAIESPLSTSFGPGFTSDKELTGNKSAISKLRLVAEDLKKKSFILLFAVNSRLPKFWSRVESKSIRWAWSEDKLENIKEDLFFWKWIGSNVLWKECSLLKRFKWDKDSIESDILSISLSVKNIPLVVETVLENSRLSVKANFELSVIVGVPPPISALKVRPVGIATLVFPALHSPISWALLLKYCKDQYSGAPKGLNATPITP